MEKIIEPVDVHLIKSELTEERILCKTNRGGNIIYVVSAHNAPDTMREIGRLREMAFRPEGGCSGLGCDIDEFDLMEEPYRQLVVWDPEEEAIVGCYRFITGDKVTLDDNGQPRLASAHMFHFSDNYIRNYLPFTIELGRSFVSPVYQSSKSGTKSLFSMDNLWDGLVALMLTNGKMRYFFGKMTFHPTYNPVARKIIYHFLEKHFKDPENLVTAYHPHGCDTDSDSFNRILTKKNFKEDYILLKSYLKEIGTTIPPLVNSYLKTSPALTTFGAAINENFGNASEYAIMVKFSEICQEKIQRHEDSFRKWSSNQK